MIAFPLHSWSKGLREGFRTRDLHILQHLARHPEVERILVVDRPVTLAEWVARREPLGLPGHGSERLSRTSRLVEAGDRTHVLRTFVPALVGPVLRRRAWLHRAFRPALGPMVRRAAGRIGVRRPVALCWNVNALPVAGSLGHPLAIDLLDDWLRHPQYRAAHPRLRGLYEAYLPAAAAVTSNSVETARRYSYLRDDIRPILNGVDPDPFSHQTEVPPDLASLPGPILGYVGKLQERLDVGLVSHLSGRFPRASIVLLGPVLSRRHIAPLRSLPNVHLLGDRHYSLLPAYVRAFDVAIAPHAVGEAEIGGDMMKLYEYAAASRPIVTTPVAGTDRFPTIDVRGTASGFGDAVARYLEEAISSVEHPWVHSHTWSARTAELVEHIRSAVEAAT